MKYLDELFKGAPHIAIERLSQDSREVTKNSIFFCVKGFHSDGHHFVDNAIVNGAVCIVHSDPLEHKQKDIIYVTVADVLDALNAIADLFYDQISYKLKMIGVTGTNGKSTTSHVAYQILNRLQCPCGYIGTIAIAYNDISFQSPFTTPESIYLHRTLHDMYEAGIQAVSMEVSSNGLELKRTQSIDFDVAVFTNLTHEHLDFHGTMSNYLDAKKKLFLQMGKNKHAILNKDDAYFETFLDACSCQVLTYSVYQKADYQAVDIKMYAQRTEFILLHNHKEYPVCTNLLAKFNVSNLLGVIAAIHALGFSLEDILAQVNDLQQVAGRIEMIALGQPFQVIVDYAHTPDGFIKIFEYARQITPITNNIIVVFGSAGLRDTKKRVLLGELSDQYCDMIILTEEDPRTESAKTIAADIKSGITKHRCVFIASREAAISQAILLANRSDTVLILGKGDEAYMDREWGKELYAGDHQIAIQACKEALEQERD